MKRVHRGLAGRRRRAQLEGYGQAVAHPGRRVDGGKSRPRVAQHADPKRGRKRRRVYGNLRPFRNLRPVGEGQPRGPLIEVCHVQVFAVGHGRAGAKEEQARLLEKVERLEGRRVGVIVLPADDVYLKGRLWPVCGPGDEGNVVGRVTRRRGPVLYAPLSGHELPGREVA